MGQLGDRFTLNATKIAEILKEKFSEAVLEVKEESAQPWIMVKADQIREISTFLRDDKRLSFDFLRCIASVDYGEELELVYLLFSYSTKTEISIKLRVPSENPIVPSVESVWPAADWHEREAYDLMGFDFEGHPDLRRILLPPDWEGHPLRKDYKEKEEYRGVSTTRGYLTGMPELPTHEPAHNQNPVIKPKAQD